MSKKKKFWIVIGVLTAILCILLLLMPRSSSGSLMIETDDGDVSEINLSSLRIRRGINFDDLAEMERIEESQESLYIISVILRFYERYKEDKGKNLLRIYHFDDILRIAAIEKMDYRRLTFYSDDGASVRIEPQEHKDFLILLSLEMNQNNLSMRLIMPEDNFSQRWLKNVVKIYVE